MVQKEGTPVSRRAIKEDIFWVGALDPDRKLFDALMPLSFGTTYNAYLVAGSEKTALIDGVDPDKMPDLFRNLEEVDAVDYLVCNHAEQDRSGSIPGVLDKYPAARVLCLKKTMEMLQDLHPVADDRFQVVKDGEEISLGNKTLRFMHLPWVHWPETTATYLPEDRVLFSCDLFGSHYSFGDDLFAGENDVVLRKAKEYYAEIMMPYARASAKHLDRIGKLDIDTICASHGPVHDQPQKILDLHEDWMRGTPHNLVLIAYVSTHGSTRIMAEHLTEAIERHGIESRLIDLAGLPLNHISSALVDAATITLGSSVVMNSLHPYATFTADLINNLKPKARFVAFFGSYGWSPGPLRKAGDQLSSLKAEHLDPVISRGHPREEVVAELDALADRIAAKHKEAGLYGARTKSAE